jgi:hypothetical protein
MAFFKLGRKGTGPVVKLQERIYAIQALSARGRTLFRKNEQLFPLFVKLQDVEFSMNQALAGTVYDYKRKIDRTLWTASMQEMEVILDAIKAVLLEMVNSVEDVPAEAKEVSSEEAETEDIEKPEKDDWRAALLQNIEEAEEEDRRIEEKRESHVEKLSRSQSESLWEILRALQVNYREMKHISEEWFRTHRQHRWPFG